MTNSQNTAENLFNALSQDYLNLITQDANSCVALGADKKLGDLPKLDEDALTETLSLAQALLIKSEAALSMGSSLAQTNSANAVESEIDIALIKLSAQQFISGLTLKSENIESYKQMPKAGEQISSGIFLLVTNDPRPAIERIENIHSRLLQVPRFLDEVIAMLDTPVKRWVDIDCETIEGLPEFFESILAWAKSENYAEADKLEVVISSANKAMAQYVSDIRELKTTDDFMIGEDKAQALIASKGIELTLTDIHEMTRSFVASTQEQIEALRTKLTEKYQLDSSTSIESLQQYLLKKFAVKVENDDLQSVIKRYQDEADKISDFIVDTGLFPIPQDQSMNIMQTPNFMAPMIPAGAMMQPPALRAGIKTSLVYLTLSKELLDEHTELGIPVMMVHEGIPGHHLQLATASLHPSVVRKTFPAMEFAEGWTTMLEDYMLDQGYMGELTDEARFIAKLDISRISARVAIDLYFMTGNLDYLSIGYTCDLTSDDPFVNAGNLLKVVTGFTDGRVQAELNWYSQERGYPLSYLVGNQLVWALKRDFVATQKAYMSTKEMDKLFHQTYLEAGNMPVAMLRRIFKAKGLI